MNPRISHKLQHFFSAYPVKKAWVFGSYARGEETRSSDIDVMVQFNENAHISLFDYAAIVLALEKTLKKKVDLVEEGQLYDWAQESAEHDKILVYERTTA